MINSLHYWLEAIFVTARKQKTYIHFKNTKHCKQSNFKHDFEKIYMQLFSFSKCVRTRQIHLTTWCINFIFSRSNTNSSPSSVILYLDVSVTSWQLLYIREQLFNTEGGNFCFNFYPGGCGYFFLQTSNFQPLPYYTTHTIDYFICKHTIFGYIFLHVRHGGGWGVVLLKMFSVSWGGDWVISMLWLNFS